MGTTKIAQPKPGSAIKKMKNLVKVTKSQVSFYKENTQISQRSRESVILSLNIFILTP